MLNKSQKFKLTNSEDSLIDPNLQINPHLIKNDPTFFSVFSEYHPHLFQGMLWKLFL